MKKDSTRYLLAVVGTTALLAGCSPHRATATEASSAPQSVAATRIVRADLTGSITLAGEFNPFQEVDVMSKVSGYIRTIRVDVGDRVHQGQVLATLEIPEMKDDFARAGAAIDQAQAEAAHAEAEVRRAQSALEMAQLSFGRVDNVAKREPGLIPRQEVDDVHAKQLEAEAQVAAANSAVAAARQHISVLQAEQSHLKTMSDYETIRAPIDGIVTKRYANTGAMVQAGVTSQTQAMPVVSVSENRLLRLILPVPESAVSRVAIGHTVSVRVPSLGRTFPGRVARYAGKVQLSTRTMDTEVDVQNPTFTIVPGMHAEVVLDLDARKNVLASVPDAIDGAGANTAVFRIDPPGVIHIVHVRVGLETADGAELLAGVKEGDNVVVGRHAGLKEGDRVTPVMAGFAKIGRGR